MKKGILKKLQMLLMICIAVIGVMVLPGQAAKGATPGPVEIMAVVYSDESIYVLNNGNSKIYFASESDAARNNWDVIDAESGDFTMIDLSWLTSSVENIIMIKGEENSTLTRVIMSPKPRKLEVSISYGNMNSLSSSVSIAPLVNIMASEGNGSNPITFGDLQWKKEDGGQWRSTSSLTVGLLEKFLIKGSYLYFRIAPVNDVVDAYDGTNEIDISEVFNYNESNLIDDTLTGPSGAELTFGTDYPNGMDGRRAGNQIKVKISKKSTPIVADIDGEEFTAEIKYGKEYRVTRLVGLAEVTTGWTQIIDKTIKTLPLETIINDGSDGMTDPFPAMRIDIRDYATTKAAASKITKISLDAQRTITGSSIEGKAPEGATSSDKNIYISYNGIKNIAVTIPSASASNPYEYCVVKPEETFSLTRAVWNSITKSTEIKILANKAVEGGTLYIRQKEILAKNATATADAVSYAIASTYLTKVISYPSVPTITKAAYTYTKGYSDVITFDITLNVIGKKPFETEIKSIKLGTKEILFTSSVVPALSSTIDTTKVYTMTVTLNKASLEGMTNCYNRALMITYTNGTTDKISLKLTIKSPTAATALTLTAVKGTAAGTTAVTAATGAGTGNTFVYAITDTAVTGKTTEDSMTTGTGFTSGADIIITAGKYLTVYEINTTTFRIVKCRSIQISADYIK